MQMEISQTPPYVLSSQLVLPIYQVISTYKLTFFCRKTLLLYFMHTISHSIGNTSTAL